MGFFFGFPPGAFWGFGLDSFYSINRELSNSKEVFLHLHYPEKGKEEELSVYFRVDFFFVLFFGFEYANCAETSGVGLLVLLFFFSITA